MPPSPPRGGTQGNRASNNASPYLKGPRMAFGEPTSSLPMASYSSAEQATGSALTSYGVKQQLGKSMSLRDRRLTSTPDSQPGHALQRSQSASSKVPVNAASSSQDSLLLMRWLSDGTAASTTSSSAGSSSRPASSSTVSSGMQRQLSSSSNTSSASAAAAASQRFASRQTKSRADLAVQPPADRALTGSASNLGADKYDDEGHVAGSPALSLRDKVMQLQKKNRLLEKRLRVMEDEGQASPLKGSADPEVLALRARVAELEASLRTSQPHGHQQHTGSLLTASPPPSPGSSKSAAGAHAAWSQQHVSPPKTPSASTANGGSLSQLSVRVPANAAGWAAPQLPSNGAPLSPTSALAALSAQQRSSPRTPPLSAPMRLNGRPMSPASTESASSSAGTLDSSSNKTLDDIPADDDSDSPLSDGEESTTPPRTTTNAAATASKAATPKAHVTAIITPAWDDPHAHAHHAHGAFSPTSPSSPHPPTKPSVSIGIQTEPSATAAAAPSLATTATTATTKQAQQQQRAKEEALERKVHELQTQLTQARAAYTFLRGEYSELEGLQRETEAQRREFTARYAFQLLDQDNDGYIRAEQVRSFDMFSPYAPRVLELALQHWRCASSFRGFLTADDFVRFVNAADDRTSRDAQRFWFSVLDMDGDGFVGVEDAKWFYDSVDKSEAGFVVAFEDLWNQLCDMVKPSSAQRGPRGGFSAQELWRCKLGGGVTGLLLNHNNMLLQRTTQEWGRGDYPL